MKFSTVFGLFAATALAFEQGTPVKRDGAAIASAVASISASVSALAGQVASYQTAADAPALQAASDAIVTAINSGTQVATASAPLSEVEAFNLATPFIDLGNLVNTTVQAVIDKKATFVSTGQQAAILAGFQSQLAASQAFSNAVINKLPDSYKQAGAQVSQPIFDSLNAGIAAYSTTTTSSSTTSMVSTSSGQTTASGTATYSNGWETYGTTTTTKAWTWSPIPETKTWSNYIVKPTDSWADVSYTVVKTLTATWANYEATYTIKPSEWVAATVKTPVAETWATYSAKTPAYTETWASYSVKTPAASSWVAASVVPSGPVKVWQGAAPAGAVASFGVVVLGAIAGAVAIL